MEIKKLKLETFQRMMESTGIGIGREGTFNGSGTDQQSIWLMGYTEILF